MIEQPPAKIDLRKVRRAAKLKERLRERLAENAKILAYIQKYSQPDPPEPLRADPQAAPTTDILPLDWPRPDPPKPPAPDEDADDDSPDSEEAALSQDNATRTGVPVNATSAPAAPAPSLEETGAQYLALAMDEGTAPAMKAVLMAAMTRRLCEMSFATFVRLAWPVLVPDKPLIWGWHIEALCLAGGSLIHTENGVMRIDDLVNSGYNGRVYSYCHATNRVELKQILRRMRSPGKPMVTIKTASGASVCATEEHPVFIQGKGYVRACDVRSGDVTNKLQAVWEAIPQKPIQDNRWILRQEMLCRLPEKTALSLPSMQKGDPAPTQRNVSPMPGRINQKRRPKSLRLLRKAGLHVPSQVFRNKANLRRVLQPSLLRELLQGQEQSILHPWARPDVVPDVISAPSQSDCRPGRASVLSLWTSGGSDGNETKADQSRSASCGLEYGKQLPIKPRDALPEVPREAARDAGAHATTVGDTVVSVGRGLSVPEYVYNLEIEGNNNYFANSILVHNCNHLEACYRGELPKIYFAFPPGTTKTTVVSVMFPAWVWALKPGAKFLVASAAEDNVTRDSLATRRLVLSEWYQSLWPEVVLSGDQNQKTYFENTALGCRRAVTVRQTITGAKCDYLVVDDAHDALKVESEALRNAVIYWWDKAFYNRVNDERDARRIVIGQRVHAADLYAHIMESGFDSLVIPEEFEPDGRTYTTLGWTDPRTEPGQLLRPERFGVAEVVEAKQRLGSAGYASQHQQRPVPAEGALFKKSWFDGHLWRWASDGAFDLNGRIVEHSRCRWFGTMDLAISEKKQADYTVLGIWADDKCGNLILADLIRGRFEGPDLYPKMREAITRFKLLYLAVESVGFQLAIIQEARRKGLAIRSLPRERDKDKVARAMPATVKAEAGQLWLPKQAPWLSVVLTELLEFPLSKHDDCVDVVADGVTEQSKLYRAISSPPKSYGGVYHVSPLSSGV